MKEAMEEYGMKIKEMNAYMSYVEPRYIRYDTYEEYLLHADEDFCDECDDVEVEVKEIEPLWERIVADAKEKYIKQWKNVWPLPL